ncbi:MAG: DUF481 domain-containing protein [Alphaproteobacteria bacterium]|nr:DUF481 domain-containing protein [Alphaproteobacteria bacterium]
MLVLLTTLLAAPALAQDPDFAQAEFAEAEELDAPVNTLSAELGATWSTGNAPMASANGGIDAGRKWGSNKVSVDAGAAFTRAAGDGDGDGVLNEAERTAGFRSWDWSSRRSFAQARYDRFFGEKNSAYVLAGIESDTLANYKYRAQEQIGYSRLLVSAESFELKGEIGLNYVQEKYVAGSELWTEGAAVDYHFPAARLMLGAAWTVNENVKLTEKVEAFENLLTVAGPFAENDLRVYNTAALSVKLTDMFSLKLSHRLAFDNVPVVTNDIAAAKLDQTTMLTFVASIF